MDLCLLRVFIVAGSTPRGDPEGVGGCNRAAVALARRGEKFFFQPTRATKFHFFSISDIHYIEIASDWLFFFKSYHRAKEIFCRFFKRINREVVVVRRVAFTSVNSSFTRVN